MDETRISAVKYAARHFLEENGDKDSLEQYAFFDQIFENLKKVQKRIPTIELPEYDVLQESVEATREPSGKEIVLKNIALCATSLKGEIERLQKSGEKENAGLISLCRDAIGDLSSAFRSVQNDSYFEEALEYIDEVLQRREKFYDTIVDLSSLASVKEYLENRVEEDYE